MNTKLKVAISFVLGTAVGTVATYELLKKKVDKIAEEECESLRASFANSVSLQQQRKAKEEADDNSPIEDSAKSAQHSYSSLSDAYKKKEDISEVASRVRKDYSHVENGEAAEVEYAKSESSDHDKPYVISQAEFDNDHPNYDKLSITYYEADDTLADEQEEIIDDPDTIVGEDTLKSFGKGSDDEDIVYARNDQLGIDYEISRVHGSYEETVMGTKGPEPENEE